MFNHSLSKLTSQKFIFSLPPTLSQASFLQLWICAILQGMESSIESLTPAELEILFSFLEPKDLAHAMATCQPWRYTIRNNYMWKSFAAERWPSVLKLLSHNDPNYFNLYRSFCQPHPRRAVPSPTISYDDIEFLVDIWREDVLVFSNVVPGSVLGPGYEPPASEFSENIISRMDGPDFRIILPLQPDFDIPSLQNQNLRVSVMAFQKLLNKFACIVNQTWFEYKNEEGQMISSSDQLDILYANPFIGVGACFLLLYKEEEDGNECLKRVYGIEVKFDTLNFREQVMWLLNMLVWK